MIAICPAGPPKLIIPSFSQKRSASRSVGVATVGSDERTAAKPTQPGPTHSIRRRVEDS